MIHDNFEDWLFEQKIDMHSFCLLINEAKDNDFKLSLNITEDLADITIKYLDIIEEFLKISEDNETVITQLVNKLKESK